MLHKTLKRSAAIVFTLVFAVSFVSYSILSYIPPSFAQHQLAYSIEQCPSHRTEPAVTLVVHFFEDGNKKEGSRKHCVCYSCDLKRHQLTKTERIITPVTVEFVSYLIEFDEPEYVKHLSRNLSTRSPPAFSVFS